MCTHHEYGHYGMYNSYTSNFMILIKWGLCPGSINPDLEFYNRHKIDPALDRSEIYDLGFLLCALRAH